MRYSKPHVEKKNIFSSELDGVAICQGHNTLVGAELCQIETEMFGLD